MNICSNSKLPLFILFQTKRKAVENSPGPVLLENAFVYRLYFFDGVKCIGIETIDDRNHMFNIFTLDDGKNNVHLSLRTFGFN